jgi:tetratricopeptide (TPR) repeat protein
MKETVLKKALLLAKRGKCGEAVSLLESELLRYRDSFIFYYLLAISCLKLGDFGRAYTYFKSAHEIKKRDVNVLLGIAALYIRRSEGARAVEMYLQVLNAEPKNKKAKKALAVLRKYGGGEELGVWVDSGKIKSLYPPFPRVRGADKKKLFLCAAAALAVLLSCAYAVIKKGVTPSAIFAREKREGYSDSALSASERGLPVDMTGAFQIVLTAQQVIEVYEKARKYFNEYKDNSARVEINRILYSNASEGVKNKARLLLGYIDETVVGFDNFDKLKEHFTYNEVAKDSALYNGCYVKWGGRAANIEQGAESTAFELYIGYEERRVVLGSVRVECPFAFNIEDRPLDVLGRVLSGGGGSFILGGVSVHQR